MTQEELFKAIKLLRDDTLKNSQYRELWETISARVHLRGNLKDDVIAVTLEKLAVYDTALSAGNINRLIQQRINDALYACGAIVGNTKETNRKTLRRALVPISFDTDTVENSGSAGWQTDFTQAEVSADRYYAFRPTSMPVLPKGDELFPE
jgi:hypothetical protein